MDNLFFKLDENNATKLREHYKELMKKYQNADIGKKALLSLMDLNIKERKFKQNLEYAVLVKDLNQTKGIEYLNTSAFELVKESVNQILQDKYNDEKKIMNIGVVDTFFYKSKKFEKPNGTSRIEIVQTNEDPQDKQHHGTMVSHTVVNHNEKAKIFALSTGVSRSSNSIAYTSQHYKHLHDDKKVRIFNNSYGLNGTDYGQANTTFGNVAHYAATDSIFIWTAGNDGVLGEEYSNHASPQALYPLLRPNAQNGWITVMAVDDSGDTSKLASYSNKIGDKGKNWGITARGNWDIDLPADECENYSPNGCYKLIAGTSFSAPVVTAAVANVWTKFPWMDNHLVTMTILSSADKSGHKGEQTESPDETFGWGILNQDRALGGPGRLDKLLLTNKDEKRAVHGLFTVNFDHRDYKDIRKLTWNNNMAGDAGIYKKGTGTLYLGGQNTYTAITWIKEGTIGVEKSLLNSHVTIEKGGTLLARNDNSKVEIGNGNGYTITNNGGSLNVYGQGLKINGNYESKDKGRITIDIDRSNLEVTSTLDMSNDSYILADVENIYSVIGTQTKKRNIVKANEIKNYNADYKTSDNVSKYINLSGFYVDKNRQNIWVEYNRKATVHVLQAAGYVTASSLNTAKNFDTALEELSQTQEQNEISATAVRVMNAHANAFVQMIDSLSGEIYTSSQNILFNHNLLTNISFSNRVSSLSIINSSGFWYDGMYANSKINTKNYTKAISKTKGNLFGVDSVFSDYIFGIGFVHANTDTKFNNDLGNIYMKNKGIMLYLSKDLGYAYIYIRNRWVK
ncbi:hypothetical protein BFG05_06435 [Campylobacter pinnipediorum subsp. pinnipediorum]|nr:hypothetical protein BFG05_06435 [Campylobacter pinnipediorum subsp. pinnipediorum]